MPMRQGGPRMAGGDGGVGHYGFRGGFDPMGLQQARIHALRQQWEGNPMDQMMADFWLQQQEQALANSTGGMQQAAGIRAANPVGGGYGAAAMLPSMMGYMFGGRGGVGSSPYGSGGFGGAMF